MATVFEISGPLALYRKPYTTTSTVSFSIPPPTAVAGLLANILGIGNGSEKQAASAAFWDQLGGTRVAIQRLNRTSWFSAAVNFLNTKDPQKSVHVRIKHQFVRNPHYRIFVQGGVEERVQRMLAASEFHYTPTLGVAYALARVAYQGQFDFNQHRCLDTEEVSIAGSVPISNGNEKNIDFLKTRGLMHDIFPFRLDASRALMETIHLVYPRSPDGRIVLRLWRGLDVTRYGDTCVAWLPAW